MHARSNAPRSWRRRLAPLAPAVLVSLALLPGSADAAAAKATVAPASGGLGKPTVSTTAFDLSKVGYVGSEVLLSGSATAYAPTGAMSRDGRWSVAPATTAPFVTRMVVYRPADANKFNGTVMVEWLNVSGGVDAGPDWVLSHNELVREGVAWVGVSAQSVGLEATKNADPARYGTLSHPGDSYSYDIFSQAGQAVRDSATSLLGGRDAAHVIAVGESQSAFRLVTYINAVHPLTHVYDGFLVHSRFATGAALSQAPLAAVAVPNPASIRDDQKEPVLVFQTETDVFSSDLGSRQPDTSSIRVWEVAGTSHYDQYGLGIGNDDIGDGQGAVKALATMQHPTNQPISGVSAFTCALPVNTGPMHWVMDAAMSALIRWVADGTAPATAPRLETTGVAPVRYAKDANGNARGGVRTPHVDVPLAALGGVDNSGTGPIGRFCRLFGNTVPLDQRQLTALYKNQADFVTRWNQSVDTAVKAGFLVAADAPELKAAAAQTPIGSRWVVQRGDSLWKISRSILGLRGRSTAGSAIPAYVHQLYVANEALIGRNPNRLQPGVTLQLP
jgi:hypothetical protein